LGPTPFYSRRDMAVSCCNVALPPLRALLRGAIACLALLTAVPAPAQTLAEALSEAYLTNPDLKAARAQLNAVNEQRPIALGGWLPTVTLGGGPLLSRTINTVPTPEFFPGSRVNDANFVANVSQPITSGGREFAQLHLSENQIRQQRAALLASEETVLGNAATAFMNVLADEELLDFSRHYRDALRQVEVGMSRLTDVGDRTLGELALTRERLADAEARVIGARSALEQARADYRRVIGDFPGTLRMPQPLAILPGSLQDAEAIARRANADVVQAAYARRAAENQISIERAALLPSLAVVGRLQRDWKVSQELPPFASPSGVYDTAYLSLQLTMPLYQSGAEYARVRAAEKSAQQALFQLDSARRAAVSAIVQSWQQREAAQATLAAYSLQIGQAQIAVVQFERQLAIGVASTLDVLASYQDLLTAQTNLANARHDRIVADFALLRNIGGLTARTLHLPVAYYDPEGDYQQIKWKIFGLSVSNIQ
jgi:outer membrane protein